jgi:hypothetical protein
MAGKGKSSTEDQMPKADNFFAQLDTEDEVVVEPVIEAANQNLTPKMGDEYEQEADRMERLSKVKPPKADNAGDKSDNSELLKAMETQTKNIDALIESNKAVPQAVQEKTQQEQPKNLAEYLFGKDKAEEFVYDPEEAVSDPNSDSAKYHRAEIALETRKQIDRDKAETREENAQQVFAKEKEALMGEFKMSEADFQRFEKEAEKRNVTLKDIYLMIHREEISKNIAKNTTKDYANQRTRMSNMSPSMSAKGGQELQKESSSQYFSRLFNIDDNQFETTI